MPTLQPMRADLRRGHPLRYLENGGRSFAQVGFGRVSHQSLQVAALLVRHGYRSRSSHRPPPSGKQATLIARCLSLPD
jgi:hypothetical protein